jgi:uncharacterized cupin superfamily protein
MVASTKLGADRVSQKAAGAGDEGLHRVIVNSPDVAADDRNPPAEAEIEDTPNGRRPAGGGWYVLNATEAEWRALPGWGRSVNFEPEEPRFPEFGINLHVLQPGEPNCRYHSESQQEDFLVLSGECLLIVEGEERRLVPWDFVHCPPGTRHVFVGAGDCPCAIVMVGTRNPDEEIEYPVDDAALRYGAGVETATDSPAEAYADLTPPTEAPYEPGTLPDLRS